MKYNVESPTVKVKQEQKRRRNVSRNVTQNYGSKRSKKSLANYHFILYYVFDDSLEHFVVSCIASSFCIPSCAMFCTMLHHLSRNFSTRECQKLRAIAK